MNPLNKKIFIGVLFITVILVWVCVVKNAHSLPGGLEGKWQAVFLTDGQVYFGRLERENADFARLQEVYYLKVSDGLQQGNGTEALSGRNLNLIRLGGEAHGPEGEMFISRDKILFIENLKESSSVVQAILNNQR